MKKYATGKGYITLWALLGIWSVSALTSLPGLAISPISDKLSLIFPGASELDIQLLTTLPSLLIIPFILFAGYISERVGYIKLLYSGLLLFLASGILYFFCTGIKELIAVSALLGVGAGIIIPLSTALVSRFFAGERRTRQFGYVSAVTNLALVVATSVTGWLADIEWKLPFLVYLLPIFSLLLVPEIKRCGSGIEEDADSTGKQQARSVEYRRLLGYMLYYLLITYLVMAVSINLPFLLGKYGYDSAVVGVVTSLFFLAMMLPGLFINRILAFLKNRVLMFSLLLIGLGLLDIYLNRSVLFIVIGCVAAGFGYGVAQPYIYDTASAMAPLNKVTAVFAWVMTMNYVAIVIAPFVVEFFQWALGSKSDSFPFILNAVLSFVVLVLLFFRYKYKIPYKL